MGFSCAHIKVGAGTIGGFVRYTDRPDDALYLLSCSHVLAAPGRASPGDPILQPGRLDKEPMSENRVARLHDGVQIRSNNIRDVAIARIRDPFRVVRTYQPFGNISNNNLLQPSDPHERIKEVCKFGRTTGKTSGFVEDDSHTASLKFRRGNQTRIVRFHNQLKIRPRSSKRPFSERGDSGSLVIEKVEGE